MLPNWLYGKSLKKLQEIFSDGSTPPDYNEVKAQVTQNTTEISSVKQALTNNVNQNGSKNILPNYAKSTSSGGAEAVIDSDGVITVTASSALTGNINIYPVYSGSAENYQKYYLKAGSYKASGCPSGGSNSTYYIQFQNQSDNVSIGYDYGEGVEFTLDTESWIVVRVSVRSGYTISDSLLFKPMITLATDTPSDYEHFVPYAMTNKELTDDVAEKATIFGQENWHHTASVSCDVESGALAYLFTEAGIVKLSTASGNLNIKQVIDGFGGGYFNISGSGLTKDITCWSNDTFTSSRNTIWYLMPLVGKWTMNLS